MTWQSLRASLNFPTSLDRLAGDLEHFYNSTLPVVSDPKDVKSLRDLYVHERRSVVTLQPVEREREKRDQDGVRIFNTFKIQFFQLE